ncbi:hypothetical protein MA16_Dca009486 [Dendrobium catenatum]|uniref:Uncharacterized protein n=1 Tax=Dendrobium catenatum TaxID=906689 RepID=A0A2I0X515_9ASPA|nr:hypothetical protein MA16_Dca009486 [Dendrobium catenatum]
MSCKRLRRLPLHVFFTSAEVRRKYRVTPIHYSERSRRGGIFSPSIMLFEMNRQVTSNGKLGSAETQKVYVPVSDRSIENTENNELEVEPQPISHNLDNIVVNSTDGNLQHDECLVDPLQTGNALVLDGINDNVSILNDKIATVVNVNGNISLVEPSIFVSIESKFNEVDNANSTDNIVTSVVLKNHLIMLDNNDGQDCEDVSFSVYNVSQSFGWQSLFVDAAIEFHCAKIHSVSIFYAIQLRSFLSSSRCYFCCCWQKFVEDGAERLSDDLPFLGAVRSQPE